jgi:hypothetical protein
MPLSQRDWQRSFAATALKSGDRGAKSAKISAKIAPTIQQRPEMKLTTCARVAIILAVDDYEGTELSSLKFCCADAERVRNVLESTLGYEVTTIGLNKECTISAFHSAFDDLLGRFNGQSMASFVFYFAGHGVVCKRGKGWFALSGYDSTVSFSFFFLLRTSTR